MKILIVVTSDKRKRYRFISRPMSALGYSCVKINATSFYAIIKQIFKHKEAHLIIVFGGGLKNLLSLIIAKIFNIYYIVRLGGDPFTVRKSKIKTAWNKGYYYSWLKLTISHITTGTILKNCNGIILVNESTRHKISQYINAQRIWIISQYGPEEISSFRYSTTTTTTFKILIVTNFSYKEKAEGVCWILDKLARSKKVGLFDITIIGDGDHLHDIKRCAKEYKKQSKGKLKANILGYKNNLKPYYKDADILLYNSTLDATPNIFLEAMSVGLPIMVNDYPPFSSIITKNNTGFFYRNSEEFLSTLEEVMVSPSLLKHISINSKKHYEQNFSFNAICKKINIFLTDI